MTVHVRLLGQVEAERGQTPVYIGPMKQREALAALALRAGHVVSVRQLIDDLWGGDAPRSAVNLVHTYVGRLRRLLGEDTLPRLPGSGYQLAVAPAQVDVIEFERLRMRAGAALSATRLDDAQAALTEAMAVWRGVVPLDGAVGPLACAERIRLLELKLDAVEALLAVRVARGDLSGVVAELRALVVHNPLRERLWVLLLTALAHASRRAEALLAYHEARAVLSDRLGVDPSGELMQIYRTLLQGAIPTVPLRPALAWV
ncbi:AfsR/SARP family transcriptional regulator [Allorhizocola rhizosphaerae]|uniref:AfsR/SARP family transcriptional regulator n=1 Tax=Allorhizocola rhizosphaerae TaxID=1872709 RepID=UPI000E3E8572|nr:BTAD domain-containing putative transcriptional regulator [Allorhizocola rhizosphaerae]